MGSEIIEKEEEFIWNNEAEEELKSIEQSYYFSNPQVKRKALQIEPSSSSDQQQVRSDGRRLPNWALSPSSCRIDLKIKYPKMNFGGCIVYCRTAIEAEQAAKEILNKIKTRKQYEDQISLGFDIEWKPTFRQGEIPSRAAVMQICMDTSHCYVLHIIYSGIPSTLKSLLEDSSSIKVGVWISNDALKILRDYNVSVQPLGELSEHANLKLGGPPRRWSLSALTETITCKELAKPPKIRMGNWEANPLSKEQLQYAATDAFASWYIYEVLKTFPDPKAESEGMKKENDRIL